MKLIPDGYELRARVFPALLIVIPFIIFLHFYLFEKIPQLQDLLHIKIIGDFSITIILLYFIMQISRYLSKRYLQDHFFNNELHFPTTNYLLYSDDKYSKEYKEKIRSKIKADFDIDLLGEKEEIANETSARQKINEAVSLIRNKIKNGRLLLQHNIEYGFFRNLLGGLVLAFPASIFDFFFFYFQNKMAIAILAGVLFAFYFVFILIGKSVIKYHAYNYANVLYIEYLS